MCVCVYKIQENLNKYDKWKTSFIEIGFNYAFHLFLGFIRLKAITRNASFVRKVQMIY